jgi:uncharacterized SAM-binding protein YcdF (DUF218 family)
VISRLIAFAALVYLLGYAAFAVLLPEPGDQRQTDAIVVLTGGPKRIERGLDLLAAHKAQRMLVSGVAATVRAQELAAQYPANAALFSCCIDLGREAVDTRSNADEVARWVKKRRFRSVRLVTTDWHMPRAGFEIERQVGGAASVYEDAIESKPRFQTLFLEYNKYLLRRVAVLLGI